MQVKKYEAETLQEALDTIKRELGPDAVILQTRKNKKGFGILSKGSVEVTAAVSETSSQKKRIAEAYLKDQQKDAFRNGPAEKQREFVEEVMEKRARAYPDRVEINRRSLPMVTVSPEPSSSQYPSVYPSQKNSQNMPRAPLPSSSVPSPMVASHSAEVPALRKIVQDLEGQVRLLKRQLEEVRKEVATEFDSDADEQLYEILNLQGVDRKLAVELVKKAQFELNDDSGKLNSSQRLDALLDGLAHEILTEIETLSQPFEGSKLHWFTGSNGVGKTTTLLKIMACLQKENQKVGLVLVGREQEENQIYTQVFSQAKILDIPVRLARSEEDWKTILADFSALDKIFIESSEPTSQQITHLKELSTFHPKVHLVTSILEKEGVGLKLIRSFSDHGLTSVVVTHLDQASQFGGLLNLFRRAKVPYSYFSTGRKIPDDLECATSERVAALLLDIKKEDGGSGA